MYKETRIEECHTSFEGKFQPSFKAEKGQNI